VSKVKEITINELENDFIKLEGKSVCVDIKGDINFLQVITGFNVWQDENNITFFDNNNESDFNIKKSAITCIVQDDRISDFKDTHIFLKNGLEINLQGDVDHE